MSGGFTASVLRPIHTKTRLTYASHHGDPISETETEHRRLGLQRPPRDAVLQRLAFKELHDDEGTAVLLADVMNRADVRVIQGGSGSSLAPETIQGLRVASELVRQKLESDEALEPGVFGLVDHTHPACAQLLDDAVVGDGAADQRIGAFLCGFALLASEGPRG